MKSIINAHHPCPSISIFTRSDMKPHFTPNKPFWLSKEKFSRGEAAGSGFLQMHERNREHSLPSRIGSAALFLAATTSPKSADISLLLPTGAVMLFVYWIANFALPDLIMKDIQSEQTKKNGEDDENLSDNEQGSIR